ncbi:hypothetical protein DFH09DRAFT_1337320 [Mycena vulgaris]|nr:hypothetical protein DFH09DRAFT_1337320 [Mycena vulgaris]
MKHATTVSLTSWRLPWNLDINAFVQDWASLDHPVKSVTIVAKNGGERLSLGVSGSVVVGLAALSLLVL